MVGVETIFAVAVSVGGIAVRVGCRGIFVSNAIKRGRLTDVGITVGLVSKKPFAS